MILNFKLNLNKKIYQNIEAPSQTITVNIKKVANNHNRCFVCHKKAGKKPFAVIGIVGIISVFSKLNLLIPFGSRCCRYHLDDG